jgi:hypothetical protein
MIYRVSPGQVQVDGELVDGVLVRHAVALRLPAGKKKSKERVRYEVKWAATVVGRT